MTERTKREEIVDWILDHYAWMASGGHRRGEETLSGLSGQEECDMFRNVLNSKFAVMCDNDVLKLEGNQWKWIKKEWELFELRSLTFYKENMADLNKQQK